VGKKFVPPDNSTITSSIGPWLRGFIHKEYATHTNPDDRADLEQEGYLSLLNLLAKMNQQPPRFDSEEEFYFYIKAVIRNAIRDYILKFRSRFGISLFKLRRELKGKDETVNEEKIEKRLGDFMRMVGEEFVYLVEGFELDPTEYAIRQRRLSLLSRAERNCRDLDLEDSKKLLFDVIEEYKKTENIKAPFEPPLPASIPLDAKPSPVKSIFVTRTPIPGRKTTKKCASRFCSIDLQNLKTIILDKGFGYCSKRCKKTWPPYVNRIQSDYGNTAIEVVIFIALKLFRSKRRAAEVLRLSVTTLEKLVDLLKKEFKGLEEDI